MPNDFTVTKNPIARAGIVRKLMSRGYSLWGKYTPQDYFAKYPAETWPVVVVRTDGEFANKPIIDLACHVLDMPPTAVRLSPSEISTVPRVHPCCMAAPPTRNKARQLPRVVFPRASKYSLDYVRADGSIGNYTISNPIEATDDSITAYAFGKGVRSFKKSCICGLRLVT